METITFLFLLLFIFIVLTFIFLAFNIINPQKYISLISMSQLLAIATIIIMIMININRERYTPLLIIAIVTFLWGNFLAIMSLLQLIDVNINRKLIYGFIAVTILDLILEVTTTGAAIVIHKFIISTIYIILAFKFHKKANKFIGYRMIIVALIVFPFIQYYYGVVNLFFLKKDYMVDIASYVLQLVTLSIAIIFISYEDAKNKLEINIVNMNEIEKQYTQSQNNLIKAYELDKMKSEFIANVSHDLRTPINILFSSIQLYEIYFNDKNINKQNPNIDTNKLTSYLKVMRHNCSSLIKLVNNLIDINKIDAGFMNLNLSYCDIVSVIEDITTSAVPYAEARGLYIEFDSEFEEKLILCDIDCLERIILNLIGNAIKFSNKDGVIRISLMEKENFIVVSVKDQGEGIATEMQEVIFNRFVQVSSNSTKAKQGSGIGLYLVKSLVEILGGTISVNSEIYKGSEFVFTIPIVKKPEKGFYEDEVIRKLEVKKVEIELSDI